MNLSDLEVRVLKEVYFTKRRKIIRKELGLTHNGIANIFKFFKENGLTKIQGFGGTYCGCTINEGNPFCALNLNCLNYGVKCFYK